MLADPKRCRECGEEKPRAEFGRHSNPKAPNAVRSYCLPCEGKRAQQRRANNPEPLKQARFKYRLKGFGLTPETYIEQLERQEYRCAICRSEEPGGRGYFHLDHCHATETFRGLLCHWCNTALGLFRDRPDVMERAAEYVRKGGSR